MELRALLARTRPPPPLSPLPSQMKRKGGQEPEEPREQAPLLRAGSPSLLEAPVMSLKESDQVMSLKASLAASQELSQALDASIGILLGALVDLINRAAFPGHAVAGMPSTLTKPETQNVYIYIYIYIYVYVYIYIYIYVCVCVCL